MDELPLNQAESSKQAEERAQAIERLSEAVVAELGWAILNEAYVLPFFSKLMLVTRLLFLSSIQLLFWLSVRSSC